MGLIWVGGEEIDFPNGNIPIVETIGTYRNSNYARCALSQSQSASYQGARSQAFPGGSVTSCWFHFRLYHNVYGDIKNRLYCGLGKSGTSCGLWIALSSTSASKIQLCKCDGSTITNLANESGNSLATVKLYTIDLHITSFGASGNVKVYVDGQSTPVIDYTGDLTLTGMTTLDCALVQGVYEYYQALISEVIVSTEDTRTYLLRTLAPNAAGDLNEWDGDGYTGIDEVALDDADRIYTDVADEDFLCNLLNIPSGAFGVLGIKIAARACKSADASIQTLELGVKSQGSIDVDSGHTMTTAWVTYERIAETINGNPLTQALLDLLQLCLESET